MKAGRLRAAIIGCGRIGCDCGDPALGSSRLGSHAAAYRAVERTDLAAFCDTDDVHLARAGERYAGVRLYCDHRELLDHERPDIVSICTPAETHAEILRDVLEAGTTSAVLLEKPVGTSLDAARRVLDAAARSRVVVAVNYSRRFLPVYQRLVADVRAGAFGRIQHVAGLYGRGIYNNGTHLLDLLRWLFGDPSDVTVTGVVTSGADPTLDVRVAWNGGCSAWLRGMDGGAYNVVELDLVGTTGRARLTDIGHTLERYDIEDTPFGFRQLSPVPAIMKTGLHEAIRSAVENVIDAVESGRPPSCTLTDGYAALLLATTATAQIVHGAPVGRS